MVLHLCICFIYIHTYRYINSLLFIIKKKPPGQQNQMQMRGGRLLPFQGMKYRSPQVRPQRHLPPVLKDLETGRPEQWAGPRSARPCRTCWMYLATLLRVGSDRGLRGDVAIQRQRQRQQRRLPHCSSRKSSHPGFQGPKQPIGREGGRECRGQSCADWLLTFWR